MPTRADEAPVKVAGSLRATPNTRGRVMQIGDLVRWVATGQLCSYLGLKDEMHRFYSPVFGIVERWCETLPSGAVEVVSD